MSSSTTPIIQPTAESTLTQEPARMGRFTSIVTWLNYQIRTIFAFAFSSSAKADWIFKSMQQEKLNASLIIHANSTVFEKLGNLSSSLSDTVSEVALKTLGIAETMARSEKTKTMIQTLSIRIQESQQERAIVTGPPSQITYPQLDSVSSSSGSSNTSSSSGTSSTSSSGSETETAPISETSATSEPQKTPNKLASLATSFKQTVLPKPKAEKITNLTGEIESLEQQLYALRTESSQEGETKYQIYCKKQNEHENAVREVNQMEGEINKAAVSAKSPGWAGIGAKDAREALKRTKDHYSESLKTAKAEKNRLEKELNATEYAKLEQKLDKAHQQLQKLQESPTKPSPSTPTTDPTN